MKEQFQFILDNYIDPITLIGKVQEKVDSNSELYGVLCRSLPKTIEAYLKRKDFIVKGSMGQGNKAEYPWISILNRDITTSTQRGIYICYLFKKDMSGFYLTLNQGVTHFENLFGADKFTNAKKVCDYFKSQIDETTFSKNDIHLGATSKSEKGYGYEKLTIIAKYYSTNNITDETLEADLDELVEIYDLIVNHMENRSYDKVIKDILSYEQDVFVNVNDAIDMIKTTIDPDGDMPFGFNRELNEVKPYAERSNKFTRLTAPKVGKIDYLKKAVKDAKSGYIGEELVLEYEKKRLIDLGYEEYAEKINWVSQVSDSYGYDIQSYDIDNKGKIHEIVIEVKTTVSKVDTEFFVSRNELERSIEFNKNYYLYRVYDATSQSPKFYRVNGKLEDNFILDPITFMARYKYPEMKVKS